MQAKAASTVWIGDQLYVEVHPSQADADAMDIDQVPTRDPPADLVVRVTAAAGDAAQRVDWSALRQVALAQTGIPTPVLSASEQSVARSAR